MTNHQLQLNRALFKLLVSLRFLYQNDISCLGCSCAKVHSPTRLRFSEALNVFVTRALDELANVTHLRNEQLPTMITIL